MDQLNSFEALYTAAGASASPSNIDLLARGAVYGQMLGIEQELNLGGTPVGTEPGGTTFTAPPNQKNLVLNNGDVLNVNNHGQALLTTVNSGGVVDVNKGGQALATIVNSGGVVDVNNGGDASGTIIFSDAVVNVKAGGMADFSSVYGVENVIGISDSPRL